MLKNLFINYIAAPELNKRVIHSVVGSIKKEKKFQISNVNINLIISTKIHEINREYLNHDYSTDIITFNYGENNMDLDGEIFISVEDAGQNARKYGVSEGEEIVRLVIHGFLHLLGYDDVKLKDKKEMKKQEDHFLELNKHLLKKNS